jgi:hypothetical protein
MGTRNLRLALVFLLLPATVLADRHKASGRAGAAGVDGRSQLWGLTLGGDVPLWGESTHVLDRDRNAEVWTLAPLTISLAGELSLSYGKHGEDTLGQTTFVVGPRFSWNTPFGTRYVQPFAHGLFGIAHERIEEGRSSWAAAIGGGLEIPLGRTKDPAEHPNLALRIQYDKYWILEDPEDDFSQYSLGIVWRWE